MKSNSIILCLTIGMLSFGGAVVNVNAEPNTSTTELSEHDLCVLVFNNWYTNPTEAFKYAHELTYKHNSIYGAESLGSMYHYGHGVAKNSKRAIECYEKVLKQKKDTDLELKMLELLIDVSENDLKRSLYRNPDPVPRLTKLSYSMNLLTEQFFICVKKLAKINPVFIYEIINNLKARYFDEIDDNGIIILGDIYEEYQSMQLLSILESQMYDNRVYKVIENLAQKNIGDAQKVLNRHPRNW